MTDKELRELFDKLSLREKIYQLVQLSGDFYNDEVISVGPKSELGITQDVVDNSGSVLNVIGAEKIRKIQSEHLKKSKIPLLFMADVIYGYKTVFPIPLGLSSTWNPELIHKAYQVISEESTASGLHVTFSPVADLVKDPRWGRVMETMGEDSYLNSEFIKAMVTGLQGNLSSNSNIASCVKHFAAYGAPEGGREYNTVDMTERKLRQEYLPGYKAGVDSGCEMIMTSFNTVDGIPSTGNKWLMNEILRKEWGFNGVTIADYAAIQELIAHGIAENDLEAAKLGIEAGVDIDMKTPCYSNNLEELVKSNKISEDLINESCMRILKLKNKLGLFEDPYREATVERENSVLLSDKNRELSKKVAAESLVLLKNENNILPLSKNKEKIAVIGPYADNKAILGLWAFLANQNDVITIKEAFENKIDSKLISYAQGCEVLSDYSLLGEFGRASIVKNEVIDKKMMLEEAIKISEDSDVVVLTLGEHSMQSGEGGSRTELTIPDLQLELLERIKELNKKIILIIFSGRPLILTDIVSKIDAIIYAWFPGTEGGNAIADIVFGDENPSGKLTMSFPYSVGQIPVYYNHFNTGRPLESSTRNTRFKSRYLDAPNEPLFPFGFGLSYASFEYSDLVLNKNILSPNKQIEVSIKVKNISNVKGKETVQLYIKDCFGSVVRPNKELKKFIKVELNPGEIREINFNINEEDLKFFRKDMKFDLEEGMFTVYVGKNSKDCLSKDFNLKI